MENIELLRVTPMQRKRGCVCWKASGITDPMSLPTHQITKAVHLKLCSRYGEHVSVECHVATALGADVSGWKSEYRDEVEGYPCREYCLSSRGEILTYIETEFLRFRALGPWQNPDIPN